MGGLFIAVVMVFPNGLAGLCESHVPDLAGERAASGRAATPRRRDRSRRRRQPQT